MMDDNEKAVVQKAVRAMDAAAKEIDKLTAENQALAAQAEVLRDALLVARNEIDSRNNCDDKLKDLCDSMTTAIEATPVACLAQVRSEAGRKGYAECALDFGLCSTDEQRVAIVIRADEYAESIRQGGAQ